MPNYRYKAIDQRGKVIRGYFSALNEVDLEERLKGVGLDVLEYKENKNKTFALSKKVSLKDLILFCMQLEQLERAGVPILDSLQDLKDQAESAALKDVMTDIAESVKAGSLISTALSGHSDVFDTVFVGLVASGERTGKLSEIFGHLANHLKWVNDIRTKIKKATTYPIFLLFLMGGIVALMMLYVIPKLSTFLLSQNFELPFYTKALISTSNFFQNYWYVVLLVPFCTYVFFKYSIYISHGFARRMDELKLALPVFGSIISKIEIARFCRFLAITYRSGIDILECIDIAANVVQNIAIKEHIALVKQYVTEGQTLATAMKNVGQFPSIVIRMIKVGEDSGNLDLTMDNVNFFLDREVNDSVTALLGMIQPTLTIIMGGIMLWVSIAVFGPLYGSFSKMSF